MGAGPEQGKPLALCNRAAERVLSRPQGWDPAISGPAALSSLSLHPTSPPSWPGSPLGFEQALPYLQTPVICTPICGQMAGPAGSWSPPAWRGPSSQACVWQFGLEPKVGGLTMEEAQPSPAPPLGLSTPKRRPLGHSIHRTGIRARKLIPSPCPFTHLVLQ